MTFISRLLSKAKRNYNICELELLATVWSLKKLRPITWGCKIIVFSDNSALSYLLKKRDLVGRPARWCLSILEDDVEIRYRSGKLQEHVDCLSRYPVEQPEEEEFEEEEEEEDDKDRSAQTVTAPATAAQKLPPPPAPPPPPTHVTPHRPSRRPHKPVVAPVEEPPNAFGSVLESLLGNKYKDTKVSEEELYAALIVYQIKQKYGERDAKN